MTQAADIHGAADWLNLSETAVRYRIKRGTFPKPDSVEHGVSWWEIETLEKYRRKLQRQRKRTT